MIKCAQKAFERQPHGAVCLQMLFLAALLDLIIKLSIVKPVPLRHLHMEYYSGAFQTFLQAELEKNQDVCTRVN